MKMITKTLLVLGIAALGVTPLQAKPTKDITHVAYREAMTNDGVELDAAGTVTVSESVQGNANHQKLDVLATGLTPSSDYDIVVNVNGVGSTDLGTFTTDGKGRLAAHLNNKSNGKKTVALPDGFDLSQVIGLDVVDASSTPVLSVDTSNPSSLKYLAQRNLNNGGTANGVVRVQSANGKTKYSLNGTGLDASTDYQIVFNGTPVESPVTSDSKGRLKNTDAPLPDNILDLQTVEVWDGSNTAVLGTTTNLP